ncbi:chromosome segregation ATPase [Rhodopseudomonas julia]|uniref:Chromosome segregation ATPase n=1 Tax=Rhodopseudomonas julia TaxID=200617 RepID=A0ABU0C6P0_9BRAD|nr:flagellar export protein FliJ [Rhodopseudomonas julia]MDQ0326170.1 chromosome segregation ATPase [Rhodopseudomonas julia]
MERVDPRGWGVLSMKSRDASIRQKRFKVEDCERRLGQIDAMIEEFSRMAADLEHEIAAEKRRTGIEDEKHFAYSTFARAAGQRRSNLLASVDDLNRQREAAQAALETARAELQREEGRLGRENPSAASSGHGRLAS